MLSNGSRGTLMSYTDHSVQRRLKSNAPLVCCGQYVLLLADVLSDGSDAACLQRTSGSAKELYFVKCGSWFKASCLENATIFHSLKTLLKKKGKIIKNK